VAGHFPIGILDSHLHESIRRESHLFDGVGSVVLEHVCLNVVLSDEVLIEHDGIGDVSVRFGIKFERDSLRSLSLDASTILRLGNLSECFGQDSADYSSINESMLGNEASSTVSENNELTGLVEPSVRSVAQ